VSSGAAIIRQLPCEQESGRADKTGAGLISIVYPSPSNSQKYSGDRAGADLKSEIPNPKLTVKPTRLRHQSLVAFVLLVVAGAAVCVLCEAAILNNPSNIPGGGRFRCARIQGRRTAEKTVCKRMATYGSRIKLSRSIALSIEVSRAPRLGRLSPSEPGRSKSSNTISAGFLRRRCIKTIFTVSRCNQVEKPDSPRNVPIFRNTCKNVCCVKSSASAEFLVMRKHTLYTRLLYFL
jgi:hypothetical protein